MRLSRRGRDLRQRCEQAIADIAIPDPFDLALLCEAIGDQRHRRLRIAPEPLTFTRGGPCGMWVSLPEEDIIFLEQRTSSLHQDQIGLHEIGHILCRHDAESLGADYARQVMPDLDPNMVLRVLGRTSYDAPQEREAELVATLIGERIRSRPAGGTGLEGVRGGEATAALRMLTKALGGKSDRGGNAAG